MSDIKYAEVAWRTSDVIDFAKEKGIEMTEWQADAFLMNNQNQIASDMIERGWVSIETLLQMSQQDKKME